MRPLTPPQQERADLFEKHIKAECDKDIVTTMATLNQNPHVHHIPTMVGAIGLDNVQQFYSSLLERQFMPPDTEMTLISRTIDEHQLVDEMIFKFTHDSEIPWMLPNMSPTGKYIEIPLVVIVGFDNGRITHEHIYWDQASVLVQLGLIDKQFLPVFGIETAHKMEEIRQLYFE